MKFNIIYLKNKEKINKVKLQRNNYFKIKVINLKEIISEKIEINKKIKTIYKIYIKNFISTLREKYANFDFDLFASNIKGLKIIISDDEASAYYIVHRNIMFINKKHIHNMDEMVYHEFFHILSSDFCLTSKYARNSGFSNIHTNKFIGITEGYTQLLTKRYFNLNEGDYKLESKMALLIEIIVGKSLMEKLYSQADDLSLVDELAKYSDNIFMVRSILSEIDDLHNRISYLEVEEGVEKSKFIIINLIELFINKVKQKANINIYDIELFFTKISDGIFYKKSRYKLFNDEDIQKYKLTCYQILNNNKKK